MATKGKAATGRARAPTLKSIERPTSTAATAAAAARTKSRNDPALALQALGVEAPAAPAKK